MATRVSPPREPERPSRRFGLALAAAGVPIAAALSWIGYSALFVSHHLPLPHSLEGQRRELRSRGGRLSYYAAGPTDTDDGRDSVQPDAAPLLLIHSVNAAGSAYEMRPIFQHYRPQRSLFALELPGFGFSERSDREYTPRLMTDAVHAMVEEIRRVHGARPIDALALSLSCEFLARAAAEMPQAFRSVALVSPTGFEGRRRRDAGPDGFRGNPGLRRCLDFPLWGRSLFDLLTVRPSIRFFLEKTWGSKAIDEGLLDYDYLTTHQLGAQHAPYYFVSGLLFSGDIQRIYQSLEMPVWIAHGVRGDFVDYGQEKTLAKPNWTIEVFPTGALPHFETLADFASRYDAFLTATGGGEG